MKKLLSALFVAMFFIGLSSFKTVETLDVKEQTEVTNTDPCSTLVRAWKGTLLGYEVYFSSYACAENAGATNIHPGGMQPSCMVLTCVNGL